MDFNQERFLEGFHFRKIILVLQNADFRREGGEVKAGCSETG